MIISHPITSFLAFNDSQFPSLPWNGFTLDWFFSNSDARTGIFYDSANLKSIWVSVKTAFFVATLSLLVGTSILALLNLYFNQGKTEE